MAGTNEKKYLQSDLSFEHEQKQITLGLLKKHPGDKGLIQSLRLINKNIIKITKEMNKLPPERSGDK